MSNIGIYEYVIDVIHDKGIWYYVGGYDVSNMSLSSSHSSGSDGGGGGGSW